MTTSIKKEIMEEEIKKAIRDFGRLLASSEPICTVEDLEAYHKAMNILYEKISQALTRIEEETMEKALWCQFCGDELSCFGCEGIPGRTMEENRKLLLASLPPSEEKPLKDTDVPKKEKRGR